MENKESRFKIILLGDFSVGKTSIIKRYIYSDYLGNNQSTLGFEFKFKSIKIHNMHKPIYLQIWDVCGHDRYSKFANKQIFKDKSGKKN
jgi:Ras-related protein Rab-32